MHRDRAHIVVGTLAKVFSKLVVDNNFGAKMGFPSNSIYIGAN